MLRDGVVHESNHLIGCHKEAEDTRAHLLANLRRRKSANHRRRTSATKRTKSRRRRARRRKTEKKEQCIEIHLEDCDKLARQIESSYMQNKPFRGTFNKKVESSDGKGSMEVKVSVASSVKPKGV